MNNNQYMIIRLTFFASFPQAGELVFYIKLI